MKIKKLIFSLMFSLLLFYDCFANQGEVANAYHYYQVTLPYNAKDIDWLEKRNFRLKEYIGLTYPDVNVNFKPMFNLHFSSAYIDSWRALSSIAEINKTNNEQIVSITHIWKDKYYISKYGEQVEGSISIPNSFKNDPEDGGKIRYGYDFFSVNSECNISTLEEFKDFKAEIKEISELEYNSKIKTTKNNTSKENSSLNKKDVFKNEIKSEDEKNIGGYNSISHNNVNNLIGVVNNIDGWHQDASGWRYFENDIAVTGWKEIDGDWYYFMPGNCLMQAGVFVDGYFLGSDGKWIK